MSLLDSPNTEPIPVVRTTGRIRDSFRSLANRNYRRFQLALFLLHLSSWMFRIEVDWIALEITGAVSAVGLLVLAQWAPIVALGPHGAMIAERFTRPATVACAYAMYFVIAGALSVLALLGQVELWHLVVAAFLFGLVSAIEIPARTVLISEMVSPEDLHNAIGVFAIIFWLGGIFGPLIGGLIIVGAGTGWSLLTYSITCAIVAVTVATLRSNEMQLIPRPTTMRLQFRVTLGYVRSKTTILVPLLLTGVFAVFALPLGVILRGMASTVFESGADGLGLYIAMWSMGALLGGLVSTRITALRVRTVVVFAAAFAALQLTIGLIALEPLFVVSLVGVGALRVVYEVSSSSLVQLSSNVRIRGRVVSLFAGVAGGGLAVGGPLLGVLSDTLGAQPTLVISGAVPFAAALVVGAVFAKRARITRRFLRRRGGSAD